MPTPLSRQARRSISTPHLGLGVLRVPKVRLHYYQPAPRSALVDCSHVAPLHPRQSVMWPCTCCCASPYEPSATPPLHTPFLSALDPVECHVAVIARLFAPSPPRFASSAVLSCSTPRPQRRDLHPRRRVAYRELEGVKVPQPARGARLARAFEYVRRAARQLGHRWMHQQLICPSQLHQHGAPFVSVARCRGDNVR